MLSLTASAESKSEHPLGKAIVNYAKENNIPITESNRFKMTAGKGIFAEVSGKELFCGNEKYILENNVIISENIHNELEKLRLQGKALIIVAENNKCIGVIALSDVIKPEAKDMISRLNQMHTKTVLLTGDNNKAAEYFAQQTGINEVRSELLPEEKVKNIEDIRKTAKRFA